MEEFTTEALREAISKPVVSAASWITSRVLIEDLTMQGLEVDQIRCKTIDILRKLSECLYLGFVDILSFGTESFIADGPGDEGDTEEAESTAFMCVFIDMCDVHCVGKGFFTEMDNLDGVDDRVLKLDRAAFLCEEEGRVQSILEVDNAIVVFHFEIDWDLHIVLIDPFKKAADAVGIIFRQLNLILRCLCKVTTKCSLEEFRLGTKLLLLDHETLLFGSDENSHNV